MTEGASKDQPFEQVLSRLDALIKRGHYGAASLPSSAEAAERTTESEEATAFATRILEQTPAESEMPASTSHANAQETPIPVLTRIYSGAIPVTQKWPVSDNNTEIENLIPSVLDRMEQAMREEFANMQRTFAAKLRSEITAALQQRLSDKTHDVKRD